MTKTYTIQSSCINVTGGRYKSSSPMSAGKKAATKLFKKAQQSAKYKSLRKITFCLRETTQGSEKNSFDYQANRVKLAKPLVRVINGVEIVNKYTITIKAITHKKTQKSCKKPASKTAKKMTKKVKGGDCGCKA